jgi:3-oxoacyl-[acyl-carrier protein] reductase
LAGIEAEFMGFAGRVALVTGGGRGIGRGCSLALAKKGADIALTYRKDDSAAEETKADIAKLGRRALTVKCDVSKEDDVKACVKRVLDEFGKIDILICNAGIASRGNTLRDTTTEEMRRVFDTHVMGSYWCCREAIDSLRAQKKAHIILLSSIATIAHNARGGPYSMAKAAIEAMTKVLSKEEGPHGIRVNCIAPGLIETEMGRRLMKAREGVEIEELHAKFPFGRVGQPEDIGNLAAFLCSDESEYISGQTIYVHGGGFQNVTVA